VRFSVDAGHLRVYATVVASHAEYIAKKRQRIDTLIDAHA